MFSFFDEDRSYEMKNKMCQKMKEPEFSGNMVNDFDEEFLVNVIPKKLLSNVLTLQTSET